MTVCEVVPPTVSVILHITSNIQIHDKELRYTQGLHPYTRTAPFGGILMRLHAEGIEMP
jgi:hypothetical protein